MATAHRRIGVTRDPELAAALAATRGLLDRADTRSEAGQVRRLALLGARVLVDGRDDGHAARARQRLLDLPGVRPATRSLDELRWLDEDPVDPSGEASEALDWVRGGR